MSSFTTIEYKSDNDVRISGLLTRGMKRYEIAKVLGVDPATVSRNVHFLIR